MKGSVPRMIVALPRAVPIPLPLIALGPTRLNLQEHVNEAQCDTGSRYPHWRVLQHIRHNEESDHASPDVHLVQLRYSTITSGNSDILEGDVQIILGCA